MRAAYFGNPMREIRIKMMTISRVVEIFLLEDSVVKKSYFIDKLRDNDIMELNEWLLGGK